MSAGGATRSTIGPWVQYAQPTCTHILGSTRSVDSKQADTSRTKTQQNYKTTKQRLSEIFALLWVQYSLNNNDNDNNNNSNSNNGQNQRISPILSVLLVEAFFCLSFPILKSPPRSTVGCHSETSSLAGLFNHCNRGATQNLRDPMQL